MFSKIKGLLKSLENVHSPGSRRNYRFLLGEKGFLRTLIFFIVMIIFVALVWYLFANIKGV